VTPSSVVVGYQRFRGLQGEDGGNMDLRIIGTLPQHYTASHSRRPRLVLLLLLDLVTSLLPEQQ